MMTTIIIIIIIMKYAGWGSLLCSLISVGATRISDFSLICLSLFCVCVAANSLGVFIQLTPWCRVLPEKLIVT